MATIQEQVNGVQETPAGPGAKRQAAAGASAKPQANDGRDERGQFGKGNRGGPGNPFARQVALLRKAALEAVSEADIRDIMRAMKEKALAGDIAAAKLVLAYGAGKPTPPPDPDTLDQHEFKTQVNNTLRNSEGIVSIIQGLPLDMVLKMVRAMLPALEESKREMTAEMLKPPAPAADEGDMTDVGDGELPSEMENTKLGEAVLPDYLQEIVDRDGAPEEQIADAGGSAEQTGGFGPAEWKLLAALVRELRNQLGQAAEAKEQTAAMYGEPEMAHVDGYGGRLSGLVDALAEGGGRITNGSIRHGMRDEG